MLCRRARVGCDAFRMAVTQRTTSNARYSTKITIRRQSNQSWPWKPRGRSSGRASSFARKQASIIAAPLSYGAPGVISCPRITQPPEPCTGDVPIECSVRHRSESGPRTKAVVGSRDSDPWTRQVIMTTTFTTPNYLHRPSLSRASDTMSLWRGWVSYGVDHPTIETLGKLKCDEWYRTKLECRQTGTMLNRNSPTSEQCKTGSALSHRNAKPNQH